MSAARNRCTHGEAAQAENDPEHQRGQPKRSADRNARSRKDRGTADDGAGARFFARKRVAQAKSGVRLAKDGAASADRRQESGAPFSPLAGRVER